MSTREDVMVYSAMIAAFCTLASGFLLDIGKPWTGVALGVIALGAVVSGFLAYLSPEKLTPPSASDPVKFGLKADSILLGVAGDTRSSK